MKVKLTLAAVLAAVSGIATAALPPFTTLDQDQDGVISLEEASRSEEIARVFEKADVNQDGKLSRAEYDAIK